MGHVEFEIEGGVGPPATLLRLPSKPEMGGQKGCFIRQFSCVPFRLVPPAIGTSRTNSISLSPILPARWTAIPQRRSSDPSLTLYPAGLGTPGTDQALWLWWFVQDLFTGDVSAAVLVHDASRMYSRIPVMVAARGIRLMWSIGTSDGYHVTMDYDLVDLTSREWADVLEQTVGL